MVAIELALGLIVVIFGITKTAKQEHSGYKWDKTHYQDTIKADEYPLILKSNGKDSTKIN